jgi:histone H3/H4
LAEELRGTAQEIVEFMMYEPLTVKRIQNVIPYQKIDGEYAIDERALQAAYPKVSADIIHELHMCLEFYLCVLIKEAAILAKQKGLKSIQAKHISAIRLKYITSEMREKYE